jgi:ribosomal protein S18 acetylase RimI-like enzyme
MVKKFIGREKLIRAISEADLAGISEIHKSAFDETHFTSHLPKNLLIKFYKKLFEMNPYSFLYEAEEPKKLGGFIIAGYKTQAAIDAFVKENSFEIFKIFLRKPKLLKPKIESLITRIIKKKTFSSGSSLRLLSIAVAPEFQNQKIGKQLIGFLEGELVKNNIRQYGLSVKKDNIKAINFYNRNGYEIENTIDDGIYYLKKI